MDDQTRRRFIVLYISVSTPFFLYRPLYCNVYCFVSLSRVEAIDAGARFIPNLPFESALFTNWFSSVYIFV